MLNSGMSFKCWLKVSPSRTLSGFKLMGATRVCDYFNMNPPEFLGSQTNEDSHNFLDEIKKIFDVMHVIGNSWI